MATINKEIERILQETFTSVIGKETKVFFAHGIGSTRKYNCQCCHVNNMGETSILSHVNGKKHKLVLNELSALTRTLSERLGLDPAASPLQSKIDEIKNQAIIGLEYVIEVHIGSNFECVYHCVLCESKFDPTTIISHLTAYNHRLQYLEKHFPTAFKEISDLDSTDKRQSKQTLTEKVCVGIEDRFGRLKLTIVDNSAFSKDRMQTTESVLNSKHIDEHMGCTFIDLIRNCVRKEQQLSDISDFEEEEVRSRRASLDSISTSSESYRSTSVISLSSSSRSSSTESNKSASKMQNLYNSNALISYSERVLQQTYKMEKFRLLMEKSEKELKAKYHEYKDKPLTHSGYKDEWDWFWKRRYRELRADGQPTDNYDFKTEWLIEWKCLMDRRLKSDIESMKVELRQKLNIPDLVLDEQDKPSKKRKKKTSKHEKRSRERKKSSKKRRRSPSPRRRKSPSHGRSHRSSPQSYRRSPNISRSPRRHRRSPERRRSSRKELSPRAHRTRRSRTPTRHNGLRSRSPKRSSSPRQLYSVRRSRSRSHQRIIRKSRSPSGHNDTRRSQLSPKYRRNEGIPSYEKQSPKKLTTKLPETPREKSMFPWKRPGRSSVSPQKSNSIVSPTITGKSIVARRNTLHFAKRPSEEIRKLCAPVPPRIKSIKERQRTDLNEDDDSEPLTIISVLSLLTALEDILGSLGPKVIELMIEAKALDKSEGTSSGQLLDNHEKYILFETIKEKLKGLSGAGLVEPNKIKAVKKAIENMTTLIHQNNEREKGCEKLQEVGVKKSRTEHQQQTISPQENAQTTQKSPSAKEEERKVIKAKLLAAFVVQGRKDISDEHMDFLVDQYFKEVEKKKSGQQAEDGRAPPQSTKSIANDIGDVAARSESRVENATSPCNDSRDVAPSSVKSVSSSFASVLSTLRRSTEPSTSYQCSTLPKPVSRQENQIAGRSAEPSNSYQHPPLPKPVLRQDSQSSGRPAELSNSYQHPPLPKPVSRQDSQSTGRSAEPFNSYQRPPSPKPVLRQDNQSTGRSAEPSNSYQHPPLPKPVLRQDSQSTGRSAEPFNSYQRPPLPKPVLRQDNQSTGRPAEPSISALPKPVSRQENRITAARPDPKLPKQNISVAKPLSKSSFHNTPNAKPMSRMYSPPAEDISATLSDHDLLTLMAKFASLSDSEKSNYTSYMEKLKAVDPARYQRLHSEHEKTEEQRSKTNDPPIEEKGTVSGKQSVNPHKIYSPGDNIDSDGGPVATNRIIIDDSDTDSDDSAILATSIANTQQKIAQMNRNLNPINSGNKIPVIGSPQTPKSAGKVQLTQKRIETVSFAGQQANNFGKSNTTIATHVPPPVPPRPIIQYPPQQLYQNNAFPPQQQQFPFQQSFQQPFQQPYQQYSNHPVPPNYPGQSFYGSFQPPAYPPFFPPR